MVSAANLAVDVVFVHVNEFIQPMRVIERVASVDEAP